jgi:lipopolysaccharide biosynthesis protein
VYNCSQRSIVPQKSDLTHLTRWRARAVHIVSKVAALTVGAAYTSQPVTRARAWIDRRSPRPTFSGPVAVVAHVYYIDLIGEILECFYRLPEGSDLIITTPHDRIDEARRALGDVAGACILPVENRGRDIAPFLAVLEGGLLKRYHAVLKLHTKRSPHLRDGDIRRRLLFNSLAGSRRHVANVLRFFEDPGVGCVGWSACWRVQSWYWHSNRSRVDDLCNGMEIEARSMPTFFEGTMFWVSPRALSKLAQLGLNPECFEEERGQLDGALHHAIERLFSSVAAAEGYSTRDTKGRLLLQSKSGVVSAVFKTEAEVAER